MADKQLKDKVKEDGLDNEGGHLSVSSRVLGRGFMYYRSKGPIILKNPILHDLLIILRKVFIRS